MRFRNIKIGDRIKIGEIEYLVGKIYQYYIAVLNLTTGRPDTFTFGDLVVAGLESGVPDR